MSESVMAALSREGFTCAVRTLHPRDLLSMDLVLLTNSLMGPVPVLSLDGDPLRVSWEILEMIHRGTT
jgi:branched-subunit amino acid aminotransferase/4-amino-4-deoxychorismate lyase